jgi:sulfotransferase 6B1
VTTLTATKGRLFFTTIPKAGKNVVYSFLHALQFKRLHTPSRDLASQHTYLRHFPELTRRATYALPAATQSETSLDASMREFKAELRALQDGQALQGHFAFDVELHRELVAQDIPGAFVYRDPRDCALSMANYVLHKQMPPHLAERLGHLPLEQVLEVLLTGDGQLIPFADYMNSFRGWLTAPGVLSIRFEDMIGAHGGGAAGMQRRVFAELAQRMGWRGRPEELQQAIEAAFSPGASTFFRGQIGAWREAFSPHIQQTFDKHAGDLVAAWGY